MIAFAAATTPYRVILDRIRWSEIGIDNALLLTPKAGSGAMHKSPASLGEALVAMRDEKLMAKSTSARNFFKKHVPEVELRPERQPNKLLLPGGLSRR